MRGRPNRTATYWPPTLMAISVSFPLSRAAQPEARGSAFWWLSLPHLVSNSSDLQLNQGSRGPLLLGGGFPYHIYSNTLDLQLTDFLSLPSYIIVQSPTQSLEWHVWSSSSGNNCHAGHRSLSSGVSVYECTMGFSSALVRQLVSEKEKLSIQTC